MGARGRGTLCEYLFFFVDVDLSVELNALPGMFMASEVVLVIGIGGDRFGLPSVRVLFSPEDRKLDMIDDTVGFKTNFL